MIKTFTCIVCPNGCDIEVKIEKDEIVSIEGATCPRGKEYVKNELTHPMRTIASSVRINGGYLPLVSVRTDKPIPKDKIFDVIKEIKKVSVTAPIHIGDIVIKNVLGLDSNVIATKEILMTK